MLVQQDISQFNGFGQGNIPGKYTFSSGFKRTDTGITPSWKIASDTASLTALHTAFTELNGDIWSVDGSDLFGNGLTQHTVNQIGVITDQKNRLLYFRNSSHLGNLDGVTYTDNWKDLGTAATFRPMELYEDMVFMGNKNNVAALFTSDDSINASAFSFATGFSVKCIKVGKSGILIGANFQNKGYLVLWDGNSIRSIAPWITLPTTISSITTDENGTWIVTTANSIFITNGYSLEPYAELPNVNTNNAIFADVLNTGTLYHNGRLFIAFNPKSSYTPTFKMPAGVLIYDSKSRLWEHVPVSNKDTVKAKVGALFLDTSLNIWVSYGTTSPSATYNIGKLTEAAPTKAILITDELGQGSNPKYAEALIANIRYSPNQSIRYTNPSWTITAKIYDFKRQLYGYGLTNGTSATTNTIKNTGNTAQYQSAQVGDEITILNGNNSGETRHITAIADPGTSTEIWTLDSALPNVTASGVYIQITPFKTISSKAMTASGDYYFDIQNRPKGKRFLAKLMVETTDSNVMLPELTGLTFIYDDNPTV